MNLENQAVYKHIRSAHNLKRLGSRCFDLFARERRCLSENIGNLSVAAYGSYVGHDSNITMQTRRNAKENTRERIS